MTVRILTGDCREVLRALPDCSVQTCVTSPPYYSLRDYGVAGQIGLEATPEEYVAEMVGVFREVWRVLRDDGTLWLNLGDSYAGSWGARGRGEGTNAARMDLEEKHGTSAPARKGFADAGIKPKDLMGIPWMVAFALRADGWYLRRDIIWNKPNPMPESCRDRCTTSHEYVFHLTKSGRYFYDADAIREDSETNDMRRPFAPGQVDARGNGHDRRAAQPMRKVKVPGGWDQGDGGHGTIHRAGRTEATYQAAEIRPGRNARSVWTIPTEPFPEAHFATFPSKLAARCITAGTSAGGACAACGAPYERVVERGQADLERQRACGGDADGEYHGQSTKGHDAAGVQDASAVKARILAGMVQKRTAGWQQTCDCPPAPPVPCVVLDPFGGAGTTAMVADQLGRSAISIELNPDYVVMQQKRLRDDAGLFADIEQAPDA